MSAAAVVAGDAQWTTLVGDVALDPFGGAGTTALAALREGRRAILCELNPGYVAIQQERLAMMSPDAPAPSRPQRSARAERSAVAQLSLLDRAGGSK